MGYRAKKVVIQIYTLCYSIREIDNKIIARSQVCCDLFYQCGSARHLVKENFEDRKKIRKKFSGGAAPGQDEDLAQSGPLPHDTAAISLPGNGYAQQGSTLHCAVHADWYGAGLI